MKQIIKGKEIYTGKNILCNADILVEDGKIIDVGRFSDGDSEIIDLSDYRILPGLIDTHIHGSNGYDAMDGTYEALNEMSKYLATVGVTSFVATTVTSYLDKILAAVVNIAASMEKGVSGAKLLGSYVEGPYITKEHKGAHPEQLIRELNVNEIEDIIERSRNTVRIITIAPEKPGAAEIITKLVQRGIKVSLGHSNATYTEAVEAMEGGADRVVHIFNGMRSLHHREAGLIGAVLNKDGIKAEMICDCIHVSPPAMQIVLRCKRKEDILLITDSMMAGGLRDGEYMLGEFKVRVDNGVARTESGSLAGSTLKLIEGIKNMNLVVGASLEDSINMATINPAKALNIDSEVGTIEKGKWADIIAMDDSFRVVFTMVNGKVIFNNAGRD